MIKYVKLSIFLLLSFTLSAQSIVGGAGICMTNGNPNSITSLSVINSLYSCTIVKDTTTGVLYSYDNTKAVGLKWVIVPHLSQDSTLNWLAGGNNVTTSGVIGTLTAQDFITKTNNLERIRVLSGGNVGIGTATPGQKLEVAGTTKTTNLQVTNSATDGYIAKTDALGNLSWTDPSAIIEKVRTGYYVEDFGTATGVNDNAIMTAFLAAIGANEATLYVDKALRFTQNFSLPKNATLNFSDGGLITLAAGNYLTFNNNEIFAPRRRIFASEQTNQSGMMYGQCASIFWSEWIGVIPNSGINYSVSPNAFIFDFYRFASLGTTIGFSSGQFNAGLSNDLSNLKIHFETGAIFTGTLHVAGATAPNISQNVKVMGDINTYSRLGLYQCDSIFVQNINCYSDATKEYSGLKGGGVHVYYNAKNVQIGNVYVQSAERQAAFAVDDDVTVVANHYNTVQVANINIKATEVYGVNIYRSKVVAGDINIDRYGIGSLASPNIAVNAVSDFQTTNKVQGVNISKGSLKADKIKIGKGGNLAENGINISSTGELIADIIDIDSAVLNGIYNAGTIRANKIIIRNSGRGISNAGTIIADVIEIYNSNNEGVLNTGTIKYNKLIVQNAQKEGVLNNTNGVITGLITELTNNSLSGSYYQLNHVGSKADVGILSARINNGVRAGGVLINSSNFTGSVYIDSCGKTGGDGLYAFFVNAAKNIVIEKGEISNTYNQAFRLVTVDSSVFSHLVIRDIVTGNGVIVSGVSTSSVYFINVQNKTTLSNGIGFKYYELNCSNVSKSGQNTTITSKFELTSLQAGSTSDSIVTSASGVLKRLSIAEVAGWSVNSTTTYTQSNKVGIGTLIPAYKLDVDSRAYGTEPLRLKGLLQGNLTDSLLSSENGVVKRITPTSVVNRVMLDSCMVGITSLATIGALTGTTQSVFLPRTIGDPSNYYILITPHSDTVGNQSYTVVLNSLTATSFQYGVYNGNTAGTISYKIQWKVCPNGY